MTRTQNQGKAAFPPNENNIGGMHQILNDFKHMQSRLQVAGPTVGQLVRYKDAPPQLSMAQRLSINRARRRGAVDLTAVSHINRVYHMHRRIEESYSATERKKSEWDVSVHPVYQKRSEAFARSLLLQEMEELENQAQTMASAHDHGRTHQHTTRPVPAHHSQRLSAHGIMAGSSSSYNIYGAAGRATVGATQRPLSAPAYGAHRGRRNAGLPMLGGLGGAARGDGYRGVSLGASLKDAFPSGRYQDEARSVDGAIYRKAIMQEVLDARLYKERDLQRLFRQYIKLAPLRDKDLVQDVVDELKQELNVR